MVLIEEAVLVDSAPSAETGAGQSAVSLAAIIIGAVAAAATSLILAALGSAAGLASVSPWQSLGQAATTFSLMAALWLIIIQWAASAMGGYLTGRLRVKWSGVHTDEVFFRDTAHGFLAWALSTLFVAALVTGAGALALNAGAKATDSPYAYQVDYLLRSPSAPASASDSSRAEVQGIIAHSLAAGQLSEADQSYLADLVAARTGLSPSDAAARVNADFTDAKVAADKARKTASSVSLFTAISMLIGAFIACVAAALGGKQRDEHL